METIIENWQLVTVLEGEHSIGKVLWGICVEDMSFRFTKGDYICTSKLVEINPKEGLLKTASGSIYKVVGRGGKASIDYRDFELLRNGFSPEQIHELKTATQQH
jgi:hypothetical protein